MDSELGREFLALNRDLSIQVLAHSRILSVILQTLSPSQLQLVKDLLESQGEVDEPLKRKSPLGDKTISKLVAIWGIDELEFIRRDDMKNDNFMCNRTPEQIDYCDKLRKILENSDEKTKLIVRNGTQMTKCFINT